MKGIIFNEFLTLVENRFGLEMTDAIITDANLASNGAYTAVGSYPASEMVALLGQLSARTGLSLAELLDTYGQYLFGRLAQGYRHFLEGINDPLTLLASLENIIHVEVLKLYPDAELPTFETQWLDDHTLRMHYHSPRGMAALAHGLITGCCAHYEVPVTITRTDLQPDGTDTVFVVQRQTPPYVSQSN